MKNNEEKHIHPITRVVNDVVSVLTEKGFEVVLGPEIENEHYNFDALNVPKDHPARDMQDTFFLKPIGSGKLLRTQTSAVQARFMEKNQPPFKIVSPGKVFRNENTDATHEVQFHQVEGLVVAKDASLAQLKGTLIDVLKKLFGDNVKMRLRPGFFPFVEPAVEIDMVCSRCDAKGCPSCKGNGWIEVLGAGMVHPNVLNEAGIDSRKWQGFAFGIGVERLAALKYGVEDVRLLYSGDLRFNNQF